MEPPSARVSVACSLSGQGIGVRHLAPVVACSSASDRPTGMLPAAHTGPAEGRRPVTTPHALTCAHCGDVIGVYEPLVLETASGRHDTSLAADPGVIQSARPGYHRACYELVHDGS